MKPVRPGDNNKVIGLAVGVVAVFFFVIYRTMSAMGGSAPAAPPPDAGMGVQGPQETVGTGPAPTGDAPKEDLIAIGTFAPGTTPNPFHKDTDGGVIPPGLLAAAKTETHIRRTKEEEKAVPIVAPPVAVPDEQPMLVSGVITGINPVATITVGDKQYVVSKGEVFDKGLVVKDITTTQVSIQEGKITRNLKVGVRPAGVSRPVNVGPTGTIPPGSVLPPGGLAPNTVPPQTGNSQFHERNLPPPNSTLRGDILPQ